MAVKNNLCVVQFIHPGVEPTPQGKIVPWNQTTKHYRKYMCCSGKYMKNGAEVQDRLMFWGEWEPDSYIIKDFGSKIPPRYLQKPLWPCQYPSEFSDCGTDPFVFNKPFIYDFCGQDHYPFLHNLAIGSLILFGFHKDSHFIVDTVFVVGDYFDYDKNSLKYLQSRLSEKEYLAIEQQMPFLKKRETYRCYLAATPQNPYYGMYSYVPCCLYKDCTGKEQTPKMLRIDESCQEIKERWGDFKVAVEEDESKMEMITGINTNLRQGKKKTVMSIDDIKDVWNDIRQLTFDQGLLEGTRFYL